MPPRRRMTSCPADRGMWHGRDLPSLAPTHRALPRRSPVCPGTWKGCAISYARRMWSSAKSERRKRKYQVTAATGIGGSPAPFSGWRSRSRDIFVLPGFGRCRQSRCTCGMRTSALVLPLALAPILDWQPRAGPDASAWRGRPVAVSAAFAARRFPVSLLALRMPAWRGTSSARRPCRASGGHIASG